MNTRALIAAARDARKHAYAPYSRYGVGAAILTRDGRTFTGCNVENASYGLTVCAERNAAFQAVAAGSRAFATVVVATRDGATPCGACLQVLREFAEDLDVLLVRPTGAATKTTLCALLPRAFVSRKNGPTARRSR